MCLLVTVLKSQYGTFKVHRGQGSFKKVIWLEILQNTSVFSFWTNNPICSKYVAKESRLEIVLI